MRAAIIAVGITCLVGLAPGEDEPRKRFDKVIAPMVAAINAKDYTTISEDFADVMQKFFPPEKVKPFFQNLSAGLGKITKLDDPRLFPPSKAVYPAHFERGVLDITIVLDNQDEIIGLWFLPHTPDTPVPEKHETKLRIPFRGRWLVCWGGRHQGAQSTP